MYKTKCTFKVWNDTNKYAVILDKLVQFFDTKEEAEKIYALSSSIEESIYGASHLIAPGYRYLSIDGEQADESDKLSLIVNSNLTEIHNKITKRFELKFSGKKDKLITWMKDIKESREFDRWLNGLSR